MGNIIGKIRNFATRLGNSIFFFSSILLVILAATFYFGLGKETTAILTEQMLHREQIVARSGAKSIQSFINLLGNSTAALGQSPSVLKYNSDTQKEMDDFISAWGDTPAAGMVLTDAEGYVKFAANREGAIAVGTYLGDRPYFEWTKTAKKGEYFIGTPVLSKTGASKDKFIVVILAPVIDSQGTFKGALEVSVLISDLTAFYLEPLSFSEDTVVYLIEERGVLISSPHPQLVGQNYIDFLKSNPFLGAVLLAGTFEGVVASKEEGKLDVVLPNVREGNKLTRFLVAHSPVIFTNQHWTLAVATPIDDALAFIAPIYFRQIIVFLISYLALLVFGLRVAKIVGYREGYSRHGEIHGEESADIHK